MHYDRKAAVLLLLLGTILLLSTSLYITPLTISDADPSTYVIVPTLMLPLLIFFSLKADPQIRVRKNDLLLGTILFVLFILFTLTLRIHFALFFTGYRLDLMLLPLALAALITFFFGASNIRKFRFALAYALVASPAVLYPILAQYNGFTQLNSLLVYGMIKPFISSVQYIAPISISANGYTIGIGQACVGIGIFIALAFFLAPIAYFYDGPAKKKALWLASGVFLLFVLNLLRMFLISAFWLTYGPNSTALYVHSFVGVLLFYVAIVVMMLIPSRFGLSIPKKLKAKKQTSHSQPSLFAIAAPLCFCLLFIFLTLNYSRSLVISPLALNNRVQFNYSNAQVSSQINAQIRKTNFTSFTLAVGNGTSVLYALTNKTINGTNPILLFYSQPNSNQVSGLSTNNKLIAQKDFLNSRGAREQVFDVISNNTEFAVYNTDFSFKLSGLQSTQAGIYIVVPASVLPKVASCGAYSAVDSGILNLFINSKYNSSVATNLVSVECLSNRILWS